MKINKIILIAVFIFSQLAIQAQDTISQNNTIKNWIQTKQDPGNVFLGGYGEVHYNQGIDKDVRQNGLLDVHRMVLLMGYNYSDKLSFFTEIEYEHIKEVYIEQAFMNYKFNNMLNFKAGLLLVPMGLVNEYHEPPLFFGVERPTLDKIIIPSTWREIGMGFSGNSKSLSLKYQLYLINGFKSYGSKALMNGSSGLRSGRQKGAESIIGAPSFTGKVEYYGIPNLKLGASFYSGKTNSELNENIDKSNSELLAQADSSTVNVNMVGLDLRYRKKALQVEGQINYIKNSNTLSYNAFGNTDLAEELFGYYVVVGYDVFHHTDYKTKLFPFLRYEFIDTHAGVDGIERNEAYSQQIFTTGLNWKLSDGVVLKTDFQWAKNMTQSEYTKTLNLGVGVWFR